MKEGKKTKFLILDDQQVRHTSLKTFLLVNAMQPLTISHAYDVDEAAWLAEKEWFDYMFLDHDLGSAPGYNERAPDGVDFIKTLITLQIPKPKHIFVHSMNPIGADDMIQLLMQYKFSAWRFDVFDINSPDTIRWFRHLMSNE
jgi:hypothetical protein